jgi:8-hydroxy-5-deazaflavin:NADPH oxidoreductase
MKIAIIGAGNVGTALGSRWHQVGHNIFYGVRNPSDPKFQSLKEYSEVLDSHVAAEKADILVMATPWPNTEAAIKSLGEAVKGKILIDCTNPLKEDLSGLDYSNGLSGAYQVQKWAKGAKVVKAFNTTGFNIMLNPIVNGQKTMMLVAADDDGAREQVLALANAIDFDALGFGTLADAQYLESLAMTWISLAYRFGVGRDFGLAVLRQ